MRDYLQHGRRHAPDGSDPIIGGPRIVRGDIAESTTSGPDSDGILDPGSGDWTVTGDDGAHWTVTFDPPFSFRPTVVASENESTTVPPSFIQVTGVAVDSFTVTTYDSSGSESNDIGFGFHAIGIA